MHFRIRSFRDADVAAAVDIYNQARPIEVAPLNEERFWSWFGDPALDPRRDILVAEDDEGPLGLVAAFPWPNHLEEGYVFFVGPSVLPEFRLLGVGDALVQALAASVSQRFPGKRLQTRVAPGNKPAHAFLTDRLGFTVDRRVWLLAHHAPVKVLPGAEPEGCTVDYLGPAGEHADVVEAYRSILDAPLTTRHVLTVEELRNWAALDAYTAHSFLVARRDGAVVGLCFQCFPAGISSSVVQFLGVLPAERGKGLASHLLKRALADAHAEGRGTVQLEVSGDDDVAQTLYKKLGFEVEGGDVFYHRQAEGSV
jgi:ribosomal protein S18 acetylase RimI-like enzyme